jgi:hypothetical protein
VRPRLQDRLQDNKGSVLVDGLDHLGGARYRGEVGCWVAMLKGDVLGGGREQCGRERSLLLLCAILKSSSQDTKDFSVSHCAKF